jgi:hypothetical protein
MPSWLDDAGDAVRRTIRAYHGSPYDFDRFDAAKIGTGEGAQSYGHGLYFAGNEQTARHYRDTLSGNILVDGAPVSPSETRDYHYFAQQLAGGNDPSAEVLAAQRAYDHWARQYDALKAGGNDADGVIPGLGQAAYKRDSYKQFLDAYSRIRGSSVMRNKGHMYEVELGVPESAMLDWDAPLSQQPNALRFFQRMSVELPQEPPIRMLDRAIEVDASGQWAYDNLKYALGENAETWRLPHQQSGRAEAQLVAQAAKDAGFPGIRYLDQFSRQQGINYGPAGSRNYVMFPGTEDSIRILRKYGMLAPIPAAAIATQGEPQ